MQLKKKKKIFSLCRSWKKEKKKKLIWIRCCYISALVLACFCLTKGRAVYFWFETIVVSFLHLMVLFFKVLLNLTSKRQFLVLHCCKINKFKKFKILQQRKLVMKFKRHVESQTHYAQIQTCQPHRFNFRSYGKKHKHFRSKLQSLIF